MTEHQTSIEKEFRYGDLSISKKAPKVSGQKYPTEHFVSKEHPNFDKEVFIHDDKIDILLDSKILIKDSKNPNKYYFNPTITDKDDLENKLKRLQEQSPRNIKNNYIKHIIGVWEPPPFDSIAKAIDEAKPGEVIYIKPGIYEENIIIKNDLTIIGLGNKNEIMIQSKEEHVVLFQADTGRISNLSLKQYGAENCCAISIVKGCLELEECDISSNGLAAVYVYGPARPSIKNNTIHDSTTFGVFFEENHGCGELIGNNIYGNKKSGVLITKGGKPKLIDNEIHHGKQDGVLIGDRGKGVLKRNRIYENEHAGIAIIKEGYVELLDKNKIKGNKTNGIFAGFNDFPDKAHNGICEKNVISNNGENGVAIIGGKLALTDNEISFNCKAGTDDNRYNGVLIDDNSSGIMNRNNIFKNQNGIAIGGVNSRIEAMNNNINSNFCNGVLFFIGSSGKLENNDISKNAHAGVSLWGEIEEISLINNRIFENLKEGVYIVDNKCKVLIESDNKIFSNGLEGVKAKNANAKLESNDIHGNRYAGVAILEKSNLTLTANKIYNSQDQGVYFDDSTGILENNYIFQNKTNGVEIKSGSNPTICSRNKINENLWYGISVEEGMGGYAENSPKGQVQDNDLFKNVKGSKLLPENNNHRIIWGTNQEG